MKKVFVLMGLALLMFVLVGCGQNVNQSNEDTVNAGFEKTLNEEIIVEDIIIEKYFVDDEYTKELAYNSKSNTYFG